MGPDAIDSRSCKERVAPGGQPAGEGHTTIGVGQRPGHHTIATPGDHHFPRPRIDHFPPTEHADAIGLASDPMERRPDAVVIVLGPVLKRMVVTLRTLDPRPHEDLGRRLGHVLGLGDRREVVRLGHQPRVARGGQQVPGQLVVRTVCDHRLGDPVGEQFRPVGSEHLRVDPQ